MAEKTEDLRSWGIDQRLEFIEFKLYWDGAVNRSDLIHKFRISVPQASNDLSLYRQLAPSNIVYNASEKRFLPTPHFEPLVMRPNPDRYLAQLRAIADGILRPEETWIGTFIAADTSPSLMRHTDPQILRAVLTAIRSQRSIEIHYRSMSSTQSDAIWRRITPHAFAHDGFRWHVRAFCHTRREFRDFILGRCLQVRNEDTPEAHSENDKSWHTFFEVVLAPNPALSIEQQKTIALDYDMTTGQKKIPVRHALLYYFKYQHRLDQIDTCKAPHMCPIVILNRDEFEEALTSRL